MMLMDVSARALGLLVPETAHRATLKLLSASRPFLSTAPTDDPKLRIEALGLNFANPIGLAAGFDKDAEAPDAALKLGFGFVECGTVTPRPQSGNPRPRLFRLSEDHAVINRMGFNNAGMEAMASRLAGRPRRGILGVNIGANKDSANRLEDYRAAFAHLAPLADYIAINVSSPNTPGLRSLQNRDELERLLTTLSEERVQQNLQTPLLLKIAPDLEPSELDELADVVLASGIQGIIATNTTIDRPDLAGPIANEAGGLSGAPLLHKSTEVLKQLRALVGEKLVLIGVGGVSSGADAYAKIRAGASLVQLYTALVFQGPGLVARMKRDILTLLVRDGYSSLTQAVGTGLK